MKLRKSKVSMAVAATLGLACLAPSASFGNQEKYSIETSGANAGTLNADSGGDTLLFPFYTVANGAITNFSVTNSDPEQVIVAVIRFREQLHSVDVFDMHVILSPNDKFDFWVTDEGPNGRPMINWQDNSCVVIGNNIAPNAKGITSVEFPEPWYPFVETAAQMRVGHVEVLGVVDLHSTLLGPYAIHADVNGKWQPRKCSVLDNVFRSPRKISKLNNNAAIASGGWQNEELISGGYGPLTDVKNVLMGRYIIRIQGMEAGGDAIAISNTDLANPNVQPSIPPTPTTPGSRWFVTSHSSDPCTNITPMNCRIVAYEWDKGEWSHPHLGEMRNLAGFQQALGARAVAGDWSNNPGNNVNVDWVLSFPSKYAYMDYNNGWVMLTHPTAQNSWAGQTDNSNGIWPANDTLLSIFSVYGIEENVPAGASPGDPELFIPNETNVFTLINTAIKEPLMPSAIQVNGGDILSRGGVEFDLPNATRGWAKMNLMWPRLTNVRGEVLTHLVKNDTLLGGTIASCNINRGPKPVPQEDLDASTGQYVDLDNDGTCDDLYKTGTVTVTVNDVGTTTTTNDLTAQYPLQLTSPNRRDGLSDPVRYVWNHNLCRPVSDAVTGIIFTTRSPGAPNENDASLTELQRLQ